MGKDIKNPLSRILGDNSSFTDMSDKEMSYFVDILKEETLRREKASEARQIREIVPIEEWINSSYFVGPDVVNIYPFWKNLIIDIFRSSRKPEERINQVVLSGSIGTGKSCVLMCKDIITNLGVLSLEELYHEFHDNHKQIKVLGENGIDDWVCTAHS